mmetsp:Transcript_13563/g.2149  ORF Transcript_13563/g.2149 Transcript_13563/m.2149 type:complete len:121 (-) Transcript_13563:1515-1877(-)
MKFTPNLSKFGSDDVIVSIISSYDDFVMDGAQYQISFRVGAEISSESGIYYINWDITETKFDGTNEVLYDPPPKTMIEIYKTEKVFLTVDNIPNIEAGYTSIPIRINAPFSPFEQVIVSI